MNRFSILSFIILCSIQATFARNITGRILSESDSTAIPGAVCRLFAGQRNIAGTASGTDGSFHIDSKSRERLTMKIEMTGYSPAEIIIESGSGNLNAGNIYLSEGAALNEVTVTATNVMESRGRTIIYPSTADLKASSTSLSLFQKLPLDGLEANPINRTISVDQGTPVILINGIPSSIQDFNAIQPKDIDKIEYSRFTPARYADKGNSGFINITLKKRNDGGQLYTYGRSAVSTAFVDGVINGSYHQGPSQFTLSYNPSWRNYQRVYDDRYKSYIGDDFSVDLETHDRNPFNYFYNNVSLRYDYSPDPSTLFSATFRVTPLTDKNRSLANTSDSELGEYDNVNIESGSEYAPSLDLFFRKDFNKSNSLEVQVVGTLSRSKYNRDNHYVFQDGSFSEYTMDVNSHRNSLISEISYTHSFGDKTTLSAGYQNTVSRSTNRYLTSDYKPLLTENNNYAYVRLGQQIGKVYLSLATGAKLFWIENDINKRNFTRNLSSAQASWRISKKWNISGSFRYAPGIPSLTSLTDYPQQTTPYLISNGNPDLKVSDWYTFRLTPSFRYKKLSTSLNITYTLVDKPVINNVSYLGDRLFLSQSINAHNRKQFLSNINVKMSDIHGFGFNTNIGYRRYTIAGEGWSHQLNTFVADVSLWWNNGPYTVSLWQKIPGKYLSGYMIQNNENGNALSFEYKPNKHWELGVHWMYMFERKGTKYPSWDYSQTAPGHTDRYIKDNSNMVCLSASYSADFGSIFRSGKRSLNNSDNSSSLLKL